VAVRKAVLLASFDEGTFVDQFGEQSVRVIGLNVQTDSDVSCPEAGLIIHELHYLLFSGASLAALLGLVERSCGLGGGVIIQDDASVQFSERGMDLLLLFLERGQSLFRQFSQDNSHETSPWLLMLRNYTVPVAGPNENMSRFSSAIRDKPYSRTKGRTWLFPNGSPWARTAPEDASIERNNLAMFSDGSGLAVWRNVIGTEGRIQASKWNALDEE